MPTGRLFYTDSNSFAANAFVRAVGGGRSVEAVLLEKIAAVPQAIWFTGGDPISIRKHCVRAKALDQEILLALYAVPGRDGGGHSRGGVADVDAYDESVKKLRDILLETGVASTLVLEPDALVLPEYLDKIRIACLRSAIENLATVTKVYLDAGHSNWRSAKDTANRLRLVIGYDSVRPEGVAYNVSNSQPTDKSIRFAERVNEHLGRECHFLIDTSRNGMNQVTSEWCNPPGLEAGAIPTRETGHPLCDMFAWIKRPGESDGPCNGGPAAGEWFNAWALDFAKRSFG